MCSSKNHKKHKTAAYRKNFGVRRFSYIYPVFKRIHRSNFLISVMRVICFTPNGQRFGKYRVIK